VAFQLQRRRADRTGGSGLEAHGRWSGAELALVPGRQPWGAAREGGEGRNLVPLRAALGAARAARAARAALARGGARDGAVDRGLVLRVERAH